MQFYVYLLELNTGQIYTGSTSDLKDRLRNHQLGNGGLSTNMLGYRNFLYSEIHNTRYSAECREYQIKRWSHAKKLALVSGDTSRLKSLSKSHQKP